MNERHAAYLALNDILNEGAYANLRLKEIPPEQNAGKISLLVYSVLENLLYCDHLIGAYTAKAPKKQVRLLLLMGITELVILHRAPYAVLSEYGSLCKQIGKKDLTGFLNAVLRKVADNIDQLPSLPADPIEGLSVRYSMPRWLVERWVQELGRDNTEAMLKHTDRRTCIRAQYPFTADELAAAFPGGTFGRMDHQSYYMPSSEEALHSPLFDRGLVTVQGEGAMLAVRALGDCTDKAVLDACSAPGGKSAYLWSLCGGRVQLTCGELHEHRCELLRNTFRRLHVESEVVMQNAAECNRDFEGRFDAVLCDVPCSGLGMVFRKPDLRYRVQEEDLTELDEIQGQILSTCARYVRPGGVLVYSTCTISRRENEDRIAAFLNTHSEFQPDRLPFSDGAELQLLPHIHGTEGFYIARMIRCI